MTLRYAVLRIGCGQLAVGIVCALLWLFVAGTEAARAALAGAAVAFLPWLVFALAVLSRKPGAAPGAMLSAFYWGGAFKFILTAVLFAVALVFHAELFAPLITAFVAVLAVNWLALLDLSRGLSGKR